MLFNSISHSLHAIFYITSKICLSTSPDANVHFVSKEKKIKNCFFQGHIFHRYILLRVNNLFVVEDSTHQRQAYMFSNILVYFLLHEAFQLYYIYHNNINL